MSVQIIGLKQVLNNLEKKINTIKGRTVKGMLAAAIYIEGEARERTPQKTGVLINSAFHDAGMEFGKPVGVVGYTASYAAHVHEMPSSNNWTKKGTSSGFLLKAVTQNVPTILQVIKNRAKF